MADVTEKLVTEWEVQVSKGIANLNLAGVSVEQLQRKMAEVNKAMPGLPIEAQMKIAAQGIKQATAATQDFTAATKGLNTQTKLMATHFEAGRQGGRRLESALTGMALAAGGVTGPLSRILEGLILFGAASIPLLELTATIAAVVAAYQLLTKAQRDATKAREELTKALSTRIASSLPETSHIQLEIAAAEEKRALIQREINKIQQEENQLLKDPMFSLGNQIRLRKVLRDVAKEQRDLDAGLVLLQRAHTAASIEALSTLLSMARRVHDAVLKTAEAAAASRAAIAALGPQTFTMPGGQTGVAAPQTVLSDQEKEAFAKRISLQKQMTASALAGIEEELNAERKRLKNLSEFDEVGRKLAHARIDALTLSLQLGKEEGKAAQERIKQEEALLVATRERILLETAHLNRVAAAGGGNRFGQNPALAPDIKLPTAADVQKLANELAKIPPVGLPSAADWEEARRQALPSILQGAKQQGLQGANPFTDMVQEIRKATAEAIIFAAAVKAARNQSERIADVFTDIGSAAFGLADAGRALGFISDEGARALENVGRLSDALAAVAISASTGNIFGAIAAGATVLGSLFGGGPTKTERLLAENNQRLAELRASLDKSINNLGGLTASRDQLLVGGALPHRFGVKGEDRGIDISKLIKQLADAGMSVEEWAARIRQQTGINVLDDKGHIVAATLEQVDAALKLLIAQATSDEAAKAAEDAKRAAEDAAQAFRDAQIAAAAMAEQFKQARLAFADEMRTRLDIRSQLLGSKDPIDLFNNILSGLATGSEGFLDRLFGALGISQVGAFADAGVREKLRQQLLEWIDLANLGTLKPEDLGLTQDQFNQFLKDGADFLDKFGASVNEATKSLLNMPVGINLKAFEFAASAAGGRHPWDPGGSASPPRPGVGGWTPTGVPLTPIGEGTPPVIHTVHIAGGVSVVVEGKQDDPLATARAVKQVFERWAIGTTGSPDAVGKWPV